MKRLILSLVCVILLFTACNTKDTPVTPSTDIIDGKAIVAVNVSLNFVTIALNTSYSYQTPYGGPSGSQTGKTDENFNYGFTLSKENNDTLKMIADTLFSEFHYLSGGGYSGTSDYKYAKIEFDRANQLIKNLNFTYSHSFNNHISPGAPSSSGGNSKGFALKNLKYSVSGDSIITVSLKGTNCINHIAAIQFSSYDNSSTGISGGSGSSSSSKDFEKIKSVSDSTSIEVKIKFK